MIKKFESVGLFDVAYSDRFISPDDFIERNSVYHFKSERSTSTYSFGRLFDDYVVWVRSYRSRTWTILFVSSSARSVLQSLYDFIYRNIAEPD